MSNSKTHQEQINLLSYLTGSKLQTWIATKTLPTPQKIVATVRYLSLENDIELQIAVFYLRGLDIELIHLDEEMQNIALLQIANNHNP